MVKRALITGITGQDGSYLCEFLLNQGYEVHGIVRRSSTFNRARIDHLSQDPMVNDKRLFLHYGDLNDTSSLIHPLWRIKPHEVYNLAAQSHVKVSFEVPEYTAEVGAIGNLRVLEAIREMRLEAKFYQASTSELYGKPLEVPQKETSPFQPQSPYACAKLYAYWLTNCYRNAYQLFAANGILFNHESPRRGENFVSRKVTLGAARAKLGRDTVLKVGNLEAKRDWGYAPEYVIGMWKILQRDKPEDFVLATGETHSVREFIDAAYRVAGLELAWEGTGADTKAFIRETNRLAVVVDPVYYRPLEVDLLQGDASKAQALLGWKAQVKFDRLVELMVDFDIRAMKGEISSIDPISWHEFV